ncbi:hypothetical protein [Singulisphaera sp. PoT]|uniref:hypothetical protein n=1 Tax=Singulisphaera sp. PoT TaxID=3411797 RepID=UPI003BF5AB15
MRIPRMTVKRWMISVAVLAAFLSRPAYLRSIARKHEMARERLGVTDLDIYSGLVGGNGEDPSEVAARRKVTKPIHAVAQHHWDMKEKYEEAARRPWLLVPADPPSPPMPSKECLEGFRRLVQDPARELMADIKRRDSPIPTGEVK